MKTTTLPPYSRGWRAPWRRDWGGFDDGHTRLSCLARRIERELHEQYIVASDLDRRRLRMAARYAALAEKIVQTIGVDPKATPRRATALQRVADAQLAALARVSANPRELVVVTRGANGTAR